MNETDKIQYNVIRSKRKTIAIQIKADGSVIVRAPLRTGMREIERLVSSKAGWIAKSREELRKKAEKTPAAAAEKLTETEINDLAKKAKKLVPERVKLYAPQIGVTYGRITIRTQKSRWGSCSSKGNLNFNCLLMLAPPEVLDSVVVHELCHRKEMNHSERFYAEVMRVFPEYRKCEKWLKDHGRELMAKRPD